VTDIGDTATLPIVDAIKVQGNVTADQNEGLEEVEEKEEKNRGGKEEEERRRRGNLTGTGMMKLR